MLGKYDNFNKTRENIVTHTQESTIGYLIAAGKNIVIDNTNLNPKYYEHIVEIAKEKDIVVEFKDFCDVPVSECIKRDLKRENSVGEKVIRRMWQQYIIGKIDKPEYDLSLKDAVIFDIDGTLAHMENRGPYELDKVSSDSVDTEIERIVRFYRNAGIKIIIMTGRDGSCYEDTACWLADHDISYDDFYQREEGDGRDDSLIKREMYEKNIKGKYNIRAVFDDRNRVVDMWRELGLKCFQVADGAF